VIKVCSDLVVVCCVGVVSSGVVGVVGVVVFKIGVVGAFWFGLCVV